MPAYNQGKYVGEAIDSLKKQSFQDFIVHVVDDGSDDGETPEILKAIEYDKARVFLSRINRGVVYRARKHYQMLETKYLLVLCADDVLAPNFLEKTVEFLDNHRDYAAVGVNIKLFENDIRNVVAKTKYKKEEMKLPNELVNNHIFGSSLMRREALQEVDWGGVYKRYGDWGRWIALLQKGWKIGLVPEYLFYYRQLSTSLSHKAGIGDELEMQKQLLENFKVSYKKYYNEVILGLRKDFLEVLEGKEWLDNQYHRLTSEVEQMNGEIGRMNSEIERLNNELESYRHEGIKAMSKRLAKKLANRLKF